MNIIEAIRHEELFKPYLAVDGKLSSWNHWKLCLDCLYGRPVKPKYQSLITRCTGRTIAQLPKEGFRTALLLVGRRGGKSKIAGLIAAYEAVLSGREKKLSKGEMGLVSVVSISKLQAGIVKQYIRAALSSPSLEDEIIQEDAWGFRLRNGVRIQVLVGDFRSVRGFTQICVVVDEVCWLGTNEESVVKNDRELITAIRPSLLTTKGKLVCISTKYSKKGWAFSTWKKGFANDNGRTLVFDADTRTMNPTVSEQDIADAIAEDPVRGRSEFLNLWREDICAYLPLEVIESVVVSGRYELLPKSGIRYSAFVDVSGAGRKTPPCL